jgi:ADP-ribose pyrophosphatase YjhB (NUDIX family)
MRVKVRAVVLWEGKLLVSRERRRGRDHVLLPGGRVHDGESIADALIREVREETGLDIVPQRLLYIAEAVGSHRIHDLNLVWLAELRDKDAELDEQALMPLDSPRVDSIMPPIVDRIAADVANGWPPEPRWLGNIVRSARD